jgi:hypothetical protein
MKSIAYTVALVTMMASAAHADSLSFNSNQSFYGPSIFAPPPPAYYGYPYSYPYDWRDDEWHWQHWLRQDAWRRHAWREYAWRDRELREDAWREREWRERHWRW